MTQLDTSRSDLLALRSGARASNAADAERVEAVRCAGLDQLLCSLARIPVFLDTGVPCPICQIPRVWPRSAANLGSSHIRSETPAAFVVDGEIRCRACRRSSTRLLLESRVLEDGDAYRRLEDVLLEDERDAH